MHVLSLQVWPIQFYPIQPINENSIRLVEEHRTAFPAERQLNQVRLYIMACHDGRSNILMTYID